MSELSLTDAFAEYGAKLLNTRWAASAIPRRNELVLCLWQHMLHSKEKGNPGAGLRYEDFFWRWDVNDNGKKLLQQHLKQAHESLMPVRLVMACVSDPADQAAINAGKPADGLRKEFETRKDLVGKVTEFTQDKFVIEFQRVTRSTP